MAHYANLAGFKGISSATTWHFLAEQPPAPQHPAGAYFTTLGRDTPLLAQRLRIPRAKIEYVFEFKDEGDLEPLEGGRGAFIFFSRTAYAVREPRQVYSGLRASP
jgi:hypothetical protein